MGDTEAAALKGCFSPIFHLRNTSAGYGGWEHRTLAFCSEPQNTATILLHKTSTQSKSSCTKLNGVLASPTFFPRSKREKPSTAAPWLLPLPGIPFPSVSDSSWGCSISERGWLQGKLWWHKGVKIAVGLEGIAMCSACRMRERESFALSCYSFWDEDQSFVNAHPS